MNLDDLEPLPENLQLLLRQGRPGTEPPLEAREAVLSFVAAHGIAAGAAVAAHGSAASVAAARSAKALKAWSALKGSFGIGGMILGAALGAGGHAAYVARQGVRAAGSMAPLASTAASTSTATQESASAPPAASAPAVSVPVVPPVAQASRFVHAEEGSAKNAKDDSLGAERVLIDMARTAVARGDGEAALATLDRHARDFPRGRLVEEREWLAIQALVLSGRVGDARARATAFRRLFPHSLMLPVLEQVVAPGSAGLPEAGTARP